MKKKLLSLCVTVLLLAALLPLTVQTAFAQDYDRILSYQVDVTPNVNDGSLAIRLSFRWKALEDLPATNSQKGGVKIGIPNGSIRDMKALSDNIADIQNDNSYAYVDFTQGYKAGQEFDFSFSWVQEYMYTLNNGEVAYDYTPGWFDGTLIDEMTLTWHDPAGVTGVASEGDTQNGEHILTASSMGYGDKLPLTVTYADWPTALDSQYSRENIPEDYNNGSYYEGDRFSRRYHRHRHRLHYYDCHYLLCCVCAYLHRPLCRGLRYPLCVCQWSVVPPGSRGPSPARQCGHQDPAPPAPEQ